MSKGYMSKEKLEQRFKMLEEKHAYNLPAFTIWLTEDNRIVPVMYKAGSRNAISTIKDPELMGELKSQIADIKIDEAKELFGTNYDTIVTQVSSLKTKADVYQTLALLAS